MALLINDACMASDAHKPICPNEAIPIGDPVYVIDPFKYTECVGAHDEPQCKLVCSRGLHRAQSRLRRNAGAAAGEMPEPTCLIASLTV